jgi:hypothetical protein
MVLISTQDRCPIYAERVIGSEIIFGAPDGTLGYIGQVEACFDLLGDGVNLGAR